MAKDKSKLIHVYEGGEFECSHMEMHSPGDDDCRWAIGCREALVPKSVIRLIKDGISAGVAAEELLRAIYDTSPRASKREESHGS